MRSLTENSASSNRLKVISQLYLKVIFNLRMLGFEGIIWIAGFVYLAFFSSPGQSHFTICPLAHLGINYCPGCGLGNSVSYIFRGEIINSISAHPLGLVAILVISFRIIGLTLKNRRSND